MSNNLHGTCRAETCRRHAGRCADGIASRALPDARARAAPGPRVPPLSWARSLDYDSMTYYVAFYYFFLTVYLRSEKIQNFFAPLQSRCPLLYTM